MRPHPIALCLALLIALPAWAQPSRPPIDVVAAENFYGDVASQIGGADVHVTSILSNPDQDPHLFEASPSVARALSAARIAIYNGIDYDPWMEKLLAAARSAGRANDRRRRPGWPQTRRQPAYLVRSRNHARLRPRPRRGARRRRPGPQGRLRPAPGALRGIDRPPPGAHRRAAPTPGRHQRHRDRASVRLHVRRTRHAGAQPSVPACGDERHRTQRLRHRRFRDRPAHPHRSRCWSTTRQASDPIAQRMARLATASHVPVVGATETEPPHTTYQAWMLAELDAVGQSPAAAEITARMNSIETEATDAGAGRPDRAARCFADDPAGRVRRRAGPERLRQDHADARHPRPGAARQRNDPSARRAGRARQRGDRLHAAGARRSVRQAPQRLGFRCQRGARPPPGPAAAERAPDGAR